MINLGNVITAYKKKEYQLSNPREVKSGKEATLYLVTWNEKDVALKVYRNPEQRSFQNMSGYIAGKYHRNPSERKAIMKKAKYGKRVIHKAWVQREFHMLQKVKQAGANVPEVYEGTENSILMEFIGNDNHAAPRLIDIPQAIDIRENPNKDEFLLRDLYNLLQYFKKFTNIDEANIYAAFNKNFV